MFRWSRATLIGQGMEDDGGFTRPTKVSQRVLYALLFTLIVVLVVYLLPCRSGDHNINVYIAEDASVFFVYNSTYPLSTPKVTTKGTEYRIAIVADMDENSKSTQESNTWNSYLKTGIVTLHGDGTVSVEWERETKLVSHISEKGRGVELSELVVFNGRLYTVDDRSGIVFEVVDGRNLVPWVILEDGPGDVNKGFKGEWMSVKDKTLYVGGLGKEWTSQSGEYINDHPQYVKVISPWGHVTHVPWAQRYLLMKQAAGIGAPGYIIHESGCWSNVHKRWFFLPRRASQESYNDVEDEHRATNIVITADEDFKDLKVSHMGPLNLYHGFSSFKFIPGTQDSVILALKSEENKGQIASYIMAFDLQGNARMSELKVGSIKFEGLEFI